jgi:hypothetical protein
MQDKERMPDEKMGRFMIVLSFIVLLLVLVPHVDFGTRCTGAAICLSGMFLGYSKVVAAKRWREKYGEPTPEELAAMEKSHSVSVFRLLVLIVLTVAGFVVVFLGVLFLLHFLGCI